MSQADSVPTIDPSATEMADQRERAALERARRAVMAPILARALEDEEASPPRDFAVYRIGREWVACYRDEEWDEHFGAAFGYHPTDPDLAIADLVRLYPREA